MSQSSYIKLTRQWQYLVLEPQVNTASFPFGVRACSVWSGSALSTDVFVYSHALNFYLIIKKQLWISGHTVWNFPACSHRMAEKSSNCRSAGWCSLAPWDGWQHPPKPGGSCPGTHVLNLHFHSVAGKWQVPLGKGKARGCITVRGDSCHLVWRRL